MVFSLPFYVLVTEEWFAKDESNVVARIAGGAPLHVIPINDELCAALFTSHDEVQSYLKSSKLEDRNRSIALQTPNECATALEVFARHGIKQVFLDAASRIPGLYPIGYILDQLRAAVPSERQDRSGPESSGN